MRRVVFAALAICSGLGIACEDTPPVDGFIPPPWPYHYPTAPESLVANLTESYRRREIREYAKVLAPEFIFRFQPVDAQEKEFWTRDEDSVGTGNLLATNLVSSIRLELLHAPPETTDDPSFPPGTLKIRLNQVDFQVDQTDGITWQVSDMQDMFFRRGLAGAGEDTTRWFLLEWRDLPSVGKPIAVAHATWGKLKTQYRAGS